MRRALENLARAGATPSTSSSSTRSPCPASTSRSAPSSGATRGSRPSPRRRSSPRPRATRAWTSSTTSSRATASPSHRGYGTPEHLAALRRHGPSPEHRLTFARVLVAPPRRGVAGRPDAWPGNEARSSPRLGGEEPPEGQGRLGAQGLPEGPRGDAGRHQHPQQGRRPLHRASTGTRRRSRTSRGSPSTSRATASSCAASRSTRSINSLDPARLDVYERLAELYAKQGLTMDAKSQYQVLADYHARERQRDRRHRHLPEDGRDRPAEHPAPRQARGLLHAGAAQARRAQGVHGRRRASQGARSRRRGGPGLREGAADGARQRRGPAVVRSPPRLGVAVPRGARSSSSAPSTRRRARCRCSCSRPRPPSRTAT